MKNRDKSLVFFGLVCVVVIALGAVKATPLGSPMPRDVNKFHDLSIADYCSQDIFADFEDNKKFYYIPLLRAGMPTIRVNRVLLERYNEFSALIGEYARVDKQPSQERKLAIEKELIERLKIEGISISDRDVSNEKWSLDLASAASAFSSLTAAEILLPIFGHRRRGVCDVNKFNLNREEKVELRELPILGYRYSKNADFSMHVSDANQGGENPAIKIKIAVHKVREISLKDRDKIHLSIGILGTFKAVDGYLPDADGNLSIPNFAIMNIRLPSLLCVEIVGKGILGIRACEDNF